MQFMGCKYPVGDLLDAFKSDMSTNFFFRSIFERELFPFKMLCKDGFFNSSYYD